MHTNDSFLLMGGFMWIIWGLLLLAAVLLIKYLIREDTSSGLNEQAIRRLDQRYASGEINEEEYLLMKQELKKTGDLK